MQLLKRKRGNHWIGWLVDILWMVLPEKIEFEDALSPFLAVLRRIRKGWVNWILMYSCTDPVPLLAAHTLSVLLGGGEWVIAEWRWRLFGAYLDPARTFRPLLPPLLKVEHLHHFGQYHAGSFLSRLYFKLGRAALTHRGLLSQLLSCRDLVKNYFV
jgi:hypothetical protein